MLEYDNSAFFYFTLTLITFYLIPVTVATLVQLYRTVAPNHDPFMTARTSAERKKVEELQKQTTSLSALLSSPLFIAKVISLVVGWAAFAFLLSFVGGELGGLAQFDPYAILGIDHGAAGKEIKRAYLTLSLQYHPDKNPHNKKMAEDMFVKIAKAYEALTDAQAKENWEKYGNPDGKQPMAVSIALPTFLLDKEYHNSILIIYLLAMVVVIPSIVAMWYARSKKYGEKNVMYDTYTWYNHMLSENTGISSMAEVLAGSAEYRTLCMPQPADKEKLDELFKILALAATIKDCVMPKLKYEHPIIRKGTIMLLGHVTRQDLGRLRPACNQMLSRSPDLIEAMIELACSRRWLSTTDTIIDFSQRLVQALWLKDSDLMQLPHLQESNIKALTTGKDAVKGLKEYLKLHRIEAPEEPAPEQPNGESTALLAGGEMVVKAPERKITWNADKPKILCDSLNAEELANVAAAMRVIPDIDVKVECYVDDEEQIAEGDYMTIKVTITRYNLPEDETIPPVYAPNFPTAREEGWWVLLGVARSNQICMCEHVPTTGRVTSREMRMLAPNRAATLGLDVYVKSDSYLGLDHKIPFTIEVVSAEGLPAYEPHKEDLELDNEPTLFEQVMQAYDDSDSDDEGEPNANAANNNARSDDEEEEED